MIRLFFRKGGWVILFLFSVGAGYSWFAWSERSTSSALEQRGVPAVATVEALRTERHQRRTKTGTTTDTEYLVTYAYLAPPEPGAEPVRIEVEHPVPRFIFDELSSGEEVRIRYLPEDPERADFFGGESRRTSNYMILGAAVFFLIGLITAPIPVYMAWREHHVLTRGVPAEGTLEESRQWGEYWRVTVRFRDAGGVERQASTFVNNWGRWRRTPLGSLVPLRYDPADPSYIGLT